ncbi:uncharacterized protein LOC134752526 [Cydia strobilella]|uniref:uncharacterized protein LOC134752526 n=1 Tax=Cydia strobilella TaxID=1100964 RepID=UPI0030066B65
MIFKRLTWELAQGTGLNPRQYGFTAQKSTEDALYDVITYAKEGLNSKMLTAIVSLDDGAWWPIILRELGTHCGDQWLMGIVSSYLEDRNVTLNYLGKTVRRRTERGCIQGSIGGPLLWNLQLDPLLREAEGGSAQLQAFADDIVIMARANTTEELNRKINDALEMVARWGMKHKLRFAPHKTQAILITRKLKYDTPTFQMMSTQIALDNKLKLLGLTIDENLGFGLHIENVSTKALNLFKVVSRMAKTRWGLNPDILKTIYYTVVEPTILYAAGAWGSVATRVHARKKLDRITRAFGIKIAKAHRTVSTVSAAILSQIIPLDLRLQEQKELYEVKRGKTLPELPEGKLQPRAHPSILPHPADRKRLTFSLTKTEEDLTEGPSQGDTWRVYTDGSKIQGKVGGAITWWSGGEERDSTSFRLADHCSVYQAEMMALYQATSMAKDKEHRTVIYCDSRSSLQAVADPNSLNPIAVKIRENLEEALTWGNPIELSWIKAHVGLEGNERADQLAKAAALDPEKTPLYNKFPLSFAKRIIRARTLRRWQSRYEETERASGTKLFFRDVRGAKRIMERLGNRNTIAQLLTGHGGFKQYLHRFKLSNDPHCSCDGQTVETVTHILTECPRYGPERYACECAIDMSVTEGNFVRMLEDDGIRKHFVDFAEGVIRRAARQNGATAV